VGIEEGEKNKTLLQQDWRGRIAWLGGDREANYGAQSTLALLGQTKVARTGQGRQKEDERLPKRVQLVMQSTGIPLAIKSERISEKKKVWTQRLKTFSGGAAICLVSPN